MLNNNFTNSCWDKKVFQCCFTSNKIVYAIVFLFQGAVEAVSGFASGFGVAAGIFLNDVSSFNIRGEKTHFLLHLICSQ